MASRSCLNCMYVNCDPEVWLRCLAAGEPLVPRCANHPRWSGQMHDVPGVPCRNYRPKPAEPPGDVRRIPLGRGQYALVDAADYEWLNRWRWHLHGGYAMRREKGKRIFMHRLVMQAPDGMPVDHLDGNRAHNYRSNLRLCTREENVCNTTKQIGTSSRFKGVYLRRQSGKWRASIKFKGRRIHLGHFDDEVEAARAYDRAAVERFGAFVRPNFPEEWPLERRQEVHAQWLKADGGRKTSLPKASRKRKPDVKKCHVATARATRYKARVVRKTRGESRRRSVRAGRKPVRPSK